METTNFSLNRFSAQSFRRSCDRCYLQKLKCSRSTRSPSQCQRCERAGHQCVYSQRNPRQTRKLQSSTSSSTRPSNTNTAGVATVVQEHAVVDPIQHPPFINGHSFTFTDSGADVSFHGMGHDDPSASPEAVDVSEVLPDWAWEGFSPSPLGQFPSGVEMFDPELLYSPQQTIALPLAAGNSNNNKGTSSSSSSNSHSNSNSTRSSTSRPTPTSTTTANTAAALSQHDNLFDRLSDISKTLEGYLHFLADHWDRKEILNYPVGEVLATFQSLLATLEVQWPAASTADGKPSSILQGCQQSRTILLASHCYAVCIKIMETLAGNLCQAVSEQVSSSSSSSSPSSSAQAHMDRFILLSPAVSAKSQDPFLDFGYGSHDTDTTSPWDSGDFLVGESFAQLNPLASSLLSACTALHAGGRILCRIEVELGVPQSKSILPRGDHHHHYNHHRKHRPMSSSAGVTAPLAANKSPVSNNRSDLRHNHSNNNKNDHLQRRDSMSMSMLTQAARFLDVMSSSSDSENPNSGPQTLGRGGGAEAGEFGYMHSLNNFQKHYAEIQRMAKQHMVRFWSQVLPPPPSGSSSLQQTRS